MPRKKASLDWTESATRHLEEIRAYIARDSPLNADRFIAKIIRAVEKLRHMPHMGEVLEQGDRGVLREL